MRAARKELRPPIGFPEGGSKSFGRLHGPLLVSQEQVEGLAGQACSLPDAGLGSSGRVENLLADVHIRNGKDNLHRVKRCIFEDRKENVYHLVMTTLTPKPKPWPQHVLLKAWVDQWIAEKATMTTQRARRAECAEALGIGVDSLKQYCAGLQIPGRILQASIVKVFKEYGARSSDLVDDQGSEPASGVEAGAWADADEDARTFANVMFHEAKDLTPEQRKAIIDMVRAGRAIGKERKESGS